MMKPKYFYLIIAFLIIASGASFYRVTGSDFINQDDPVYVTGNYHVQSGLNTQSIKWAVTTTDLGYWHPLTLMSHILDWSVFGASASGHHLINLLFHIGSVLLLFLFLQKTTGNLWPSAFAAALFALHPLRVESVAWISERKDVLSMFFGTACLYAYASWAEKPVIPRYLLCLLLFALSLMSKPTFVTLPFALLLLDYWPLGRWQKASGEKGADLNTTARLLIEKIPFLGLCLIFGILAYWMQNKSGILASLTVLPLPTRIANAVVSYAAYLGKTFWPVNLSVFYPFDLPVPLWKIMTSGIILTAITAAAVYYFKKLPFLFVGWLWYLGTLFPLIGLVQIGAHAMADRYTYLPSIGIAVILSWSAAYLIDNKKAGGKVFIFVFVAFLTVLSFVTWRQCGYWKNSTELFSHALEATKESPQVYNNLGRAFLAEGKDEKALECYTGAIRLAPDFAGIYNDRAAVYAKLGRYDSALEDYDKATSIDPDYKMAYYNKGIIYGRLGRYQDAVKNFTEAIRVKPDDAVLYNNRGLAYFLQGKNEQGCADTKKACAMGYCEMLDTAASRGICR